MTTDAPTDKPLDLDAIDQKWLRVCGACDAGIGECTHPPEDYRHVMLDLVTELRRIRRFRVEIVGDELVKAADAAGYRRAIEALRDRDRYRDWLRITQPVDSVAWSTRYDDSRALYLESLAGETP